MRRLFSTFSSGPSAIGLLLLRLFAGTTLIVHWVRLHNGVSLQAITSHVIAAVGGLLLLAGLWTTVAGAIAAITELWILFSHVYDPWVSVLLVGLGVALALLGPGAWSVDARLYGWKRIEIRRPDK
jgi:putative oxidoreductase